MLVMTVTRYASRPLMTLGPTTAIASAGTFGSYELVTIAPTVQIYPPAFQNDGLFGTITLRKRLQAAVLANTASFGAHGLRKQLLATAYVNDVVFGAASILALAPDVQYLYPAALANPNTFGSAGNLRKVIHPATHSNASSFGSGFSLARIYHTSYANAGGIGNRTGTITVSTTASLGAGAIANLVNGDRTANATHACWFTNGQSGKSVTFDFGTTRIIRQARWSQDSTATHGTWQWQGSNDGSSFTNIGATFTLGGVNGDQIHHTLIDNATAYRYYRLNQTAGTTSSGPWLREVEFFIDGVSDSLAHTSYRYRQGGGTSDAGNVTASGGNGVDRSTGSPSIVVSGSYTVASAGSSPSNLVDGAAANNVTDAIDWASGQTSVSVTFDFGPKVCITAFTWEQSSSAGQGNFDFEGSNDTSSWTTVASNFSLVNGSAFRELTFTNTNAYRYYRLRQVSGSTSSSPWIREIYFKLVPDTRT